MNDLGIIVQSGCVGIVLVMLGIGYRLGTQVVKLASNHLEHIAEALANMSAKMDVLIDRAPVAGPRGRKGDKGDKA